MDYSALDDGILIAILAATYTTRPDDPALNNAVGALYDRYGGLVYSIAIQTVGDPQTAEEITQDVFVRACENANSYRPDIARVNSWLASITRHRAIDELRRRSARPEKYSSDWPEDIGLDGMDGLPTTAGPELTLETTLEERDIRQLVAELPSDQRQVLNLAFFKGLSHSQIAELLGEPLGTVKSRIRLAMQKLRSEMEEREMLDH